MGILSPNNHRIFKNEISIKRIVIFSVRRGKLDVATHDCVA